MWAGPDRARALVRAVDQVHSKQKNGPPVEVLTVAKGVGIGVVGPSVRLRKIAKLRLVEVGSSRYLLTLLGGLVPSDLEVILARHPGHPTEAGSWRTRLDRRTASAPAQPAPLRARDPGRVALCHHLIRAPVQSDLNRAPRGTMVQRNSGRIIYMIRSIFAGLMVMAVSAMAATDEQTEPVTTGAADTPPAPETTEPQKASNTMIVLNTDEGDITIELFEKEAPITTANFLAYVDSGFFKGTIFHRVMDGFMIQGGGFTKDMNQKPTLAPPLRTRRPTG